MQMISSPARAWEEIRLEEDRRKVFTAFVYPMIGLCGLSVFIGSLIAKGWGGPQSFQYAMTQCCAVAVSLFGGYFLAAYAIDQLGKKLLGREDQYELNQQFVGYSMVVTFCARYCQWVVFYFHPSLDIAIFTPYLWCSRVHVP